MYNSSCSHGWKMHKSVWLPTIRLFRLFKSPVWTNGDIIKELCVKKTLDFYFIDVLRRLIWQLDQLVSEDCAGLAKEVYEISKCCAQPHVGLMVGLHFRWFLLLP